jgi:iron complex outermembrane receptor protein
LPEGLEAPSDDAAYDPASEEVVTVTVDRRQKKLQDVSGSVEAFSEADLEKRGVTSMRELTAATPYIEVGASEGNLEVFIRGIGNSNNTEIGDPAAAFHIDGIYIPRPRGTGSMFFDIERVEVLRGPQGTLRGRNATAGTMNVVTASPKLGEWEASGTAQFGNYSQRLHKAMVNIPIGDRLALRFATFTETHDPFGKNEGGNPNIRPGEDADTFAYRMGLKWAPTDNISVTLRHDNTMERGTGWIGSNITEALRAGLQPEDIPDLRSAAYVGHQPSQSLDHWGLSGQINLDFGPVNLELLSSYRKLKYKQTTGTTNGVNFPGKIPATLDRYSSSYWHTESESYVNELRFFAPDTASFRWTVGGFALYEKQYVLLAESVDQAWGWAGQEYNHPDIKDGAYAGYADATLDLSDALRLLGGVRLTHEYKERHGIGMGFAVGCITDPGNPGYDPNCTWGQHRFGTEGFQFAGKDRTDYTASGDQADFLNGIKQFGARDTLDDMLEAQPGARGGNMGEQHGKNDDTFVDFRVGAETDFGENSMAYVTLSTGHKSGGFNDTIEAFGAPTYTDFKPESVYAAEIGTKNEFANKMFTVNAAVFWYEYKDYQGQTVESIPPPPGAMDVNGMAPPTHKTSVRSNVGDARIQGLDFDLKAKLPVGFTTRVAGALLNARFLGAKVTDTRTSWDPGAQPEVELEGNFLPRAPVLALSYGIEQNIPTGIGYFDWGVSATTKSKMYMTLFNGDGEDTQGNPNPLFSDVIPWTTRVDANIGYTRPAGDIKIEGFVSNLTNMQYMTSIINAPDLNLRFYNPPRQFGVRLSLYL